MKIFSHLIKISLVFTWLLTSGTVVRSQSGNMSDITGPNPGEMIPNENQSDITGPNSEEIIPDEPSVDGGEPIAEETPIDEGEEPPIAEETLDEGGEPVVENLELVEGTLEEGVNSVVEEPNVGDSTDVGETSTTEESLDTVNGEPEPTMVEEPNVGDSTDVGETSTTEESTDIGNRDRGNLDVADFNTEETIELEGEPAVTEEIDTNEPTNVTNTSTTEEPTEVGDSEVPNVADFNTEETIEPVNSDRQTEITEEPSGREPTDTEKLATEDSTETETQAEAEIDDPQNQESFAEDSEAAEVTEEESVAQNEEEAEIVEESEESEEEIEETEEKSESSDFEQEIDRLAYEVQVQQASTDVAIQMNEEFQTTQLIDHSGVQIYGQAPSAEAISRRLGQLWQQTGKKAAFINISLQSDQLEAFTVLPVVPDSADRDDSTVVSNKINSSEAQQVIMRSTFEGTSRKELLKIAKEFRQEVSDVRNIKRDSYLQSSQELYRALIAPIEKELEANDIDILVFSMDTGLRLLPIAALHDGEQFLIEKYALALVPSFGLTDTRYVNLNESQILAMGASQFQEQAPLPAMPIELESVVSNPRQGEIYLNENFTIANFKEQNSRPQPFSIIHLGTHAEFQTGNLNQSYIQFYDEKLEMSQLRDITDELGWNSAEITPIELLVLSACQTALGDEKAELGFAGLAVQAGVKSALASLWQVSDLGTLALMSEFYDQLSDTLIKAEALRQTQLQMLKQEVRIDEGKVQLSNGENLNLPASFPQGDLSMSHPYFWSAFTLIGNWN